MPNSALKPQTHPIAELKVTAHLMTMEEGLFCIYSTPGSAPPDEVTGLPGVRITPAPGETGAGVTVSGFNGEGWLAGESGAALVRIGGGPAQLLVTVYQDAEAGHDAPKLQVIRLSDAALAEAPAAPVAAPAAMAQPAPAQAEPARDRPFEVAAHIYGRGDVGGHLGDWVGEAGSKRWIEGFGLAPGGGVALADIEYQAVLGRGWLSPWAEGGQFCGSRGMSLPILGLRVRLRGEAANAYTAQVSAAFVDGTRVGPVSDGGAVEAPSLSPLEAFQITLLPKVAATQRQVTAPRQATTQRQAPAPRQSEGRRTAPARPAAAPAAAVTATPARARSAAAPAATPPVAPAPQAKAARGKAAAPVPPQPSPDAAPVKAAPVKAGSEVSAKPSVKRTPATTRRR